MARKARGFQEQIEDTLSNEQIFRALSVLPEDKVEALFQALYARATGVYMWTKFRKVGQSAQGQECMTLVAPECPYCKEHAEITEGNLYKILPDIHALRLFVEYNAGRPAIRSAAKVDPTITIKHCIPGKPDWKEDQPVSPLVKSEGDAEESPIPLSLREPDAGWDPKDDPWQSTG